MNVLELERILRRGASSLGESLNFYWPSWGNNEIPEANQALHIGSAMRDAGLLVFSEVHASGSADRRFDLLAIDTRHASLALGEFKRLYSSQQIRSLVGDAKRIREFVPLDAPRLQKEGIALATRFGVVAGTTWEPSYADWFANPDIHAVDPTGDGSLNELWKTVGPKSSAWGAHPLLSRVCDGKRMSQWLVFAIFQIP